jgi:hypothetical protein
MLRHEYSQAFFRCSVVGHENAIARKINRAAIRVSKLKHESGKNRVCLRFWRFSIPKV